jgi:hypothetical protein
MKRQFRAMLIAAAAAPILAGMPIAAAHAATPERGTPAPQADAKRPLTSSDQNPLEGITWTASGASCTKTLDSDNFQLTCTNVSNQLIGDEIWVGLPADPWGKGSTPFAVTTTVNDAGTDAVLETKEEDLTHLMVAHNYLGKGQSALYNGRDILSRPFGWGVGINSVNSMSVKSVTVNVHLDPIHG